MAHSMMIRSTKRLAERSKILPLAREARTIAGYFVFFLVFTGAVIPWSISARASVSPAPEALGALTFQAWKSARIDEARSVLARVTSETQAPIRLAKNGRLDNRTEQAQMNLEIAQALSVNDYIAIYLSQFKSRDAILDVARRMVPEDIADLLVSYQTLSGASSRGSQFAEHSISPAVRAPQPPL